MFNSAEKKFKRCAVKSVTIDYIESRYGEQSRANLDCPKVSESTAALFVDAYTPQSAIKSLGKVAAVQMCETCPFSDMDPLQVSIYQTNLAKAELERAQAELAAREARAEIEKINQQYNI